MPRLSERQEDVALRQSIGMTIRARRHELGLSQVEVGQRVGVQFQQIQKYETGEANVSALVLGRLALVLGVSVGYFYPTIYSTGPRMPTADEHEETLLARWQTLAPAIRDALLSLIKSL